MDKEIIDRFDIVEGLENICEEVNKERLRRALKVVEREVNKIEKRGGKIYNIDLDEINDLKVKLYEIDKEESYKIVMEEIEKVRDI